MRQFHFIPIFTAVGLGVSAVIAASPGGGHEGAAARDIVEALSVLDYVILGVAALSVSLWFLSRAYRLPRRAVDAWTMPPEWLFGLLAGMLIAPLVGVQILTMLDPDAASAIKAARNGDPSAMDLRMQVTMTFAATLGQVLLGAVYLALHERRAESQPRGGRQSRRWPRLVAGAVGALTLIGIFPIILAVNALVMLAAVSLSDEAPRQIAHQTLESILNADHAIWKAAMIAMVIVVVPAVEELLYRGIVQELLSRLRFGHWPAVIATSAAFAAAHWGAADWHVLPSLFVLSLALGWIYAKSGRLIAAITLHAAFNAANVLMGMLVTGGGG